MKTLATEIRKNGFDLTQIARDGLWAVYEQSKDGTVCGYEVINIQPRAEYVIGGATIEAHEGYPGSEQWGSKGWTYTRDRREQALSEMQRRVKC